MANIIVTGASKVATITSANTFAMPSTDYDDGDLALIINNPAGSGRSVYFTLADEEFASVYEIPEGTTYRVGPFKGRHMKKYSLYAAANTTVSYSVVLLGALRESSGGGKVLESSIAFPAFVFERMDDPAPMDFTAVAGTETADEATITIQQLSGGSGIFRAYHYSDAGVLAPATAKLTVATGTALAGDGGASGFFQATAAGALVLTAADAAGSANATYPIVIERVGSPFVKVVTVAWDAS